jgi:hypothetical protein
VAVVPGRLQDESPMIRTRFKINKRRRMYSSCSNINVGTKIEQESLRTIVDSSYIMAVTLVKSGGFHEKSMYRCNNIGRFCIK